MELLTIILSGLLGLISPVGLAIDRIAENTIRSQFASVKQLQVRVDNAPSHQLLQGKVQRVRVAGRSLQLKQQSLQIATLELETDAIEVDPRTLRKKPVFQRPLQAGLRLVLTQEDINKLLQSPKFLAQLEKIKISVDDSSNTGYNSVYKFRNLNVKFLANNRLSFQVELQNDSKKQPLLIQAESGINIIGGKNIQLVEPEVTANGEAAPPQFLNQIANNINQRLDLGKLERDGLQVRILKLNMKQQELEIAAFIRIEPTSKFLETQGS